MRFTLSRQAEDFFGELWDYYFYQGGKPLADQVLSQIYDAVHQLCDHPNLGHRREELTDEPFLFYRVFSILIIYDPVASPLHIARVYHASQDVQRENEERRAGMVDIASGAKASGVRDSGVGTVSVV